MHAATQRFIPRWSQTTLIVGAVAVWGALVAINAAIAPADSTTCVFRLATGLPCATCGGTRATADLLHGHFIEAMRMNPMVTLGWFVAPLTGAWQHRRKRRGLPRLSARTEARLWLVAGAALIANWAYLLIWRPF